MLTVHNSSIQRAHRQFLHSHIIHKIRTPNIKAVDSNIKYNSNFESLEQWFSTNSFQN